MFIYALNIIVGLFRNSRKSLIRTLTVHHSHLVFSITNLINRVLPTTVRQEFNCGVYYFQITITIPQNTKKKANQSLEHW